VKFHDELRRLRQNAGYTQKICAEKLGEESANYNKWENGVTPSFETLVKIADFFDVSVDYLLGRSPYKNYQEEIEIRQSTTAEDDVSHFGLGIYRQFKEFADVIDIINTFHGVTFIDKPLIAEFPYKHIYGIIAAYKNAIETMANKGTSNIKENGELLECFINEIRQADNSGAFIKVLLEEMAK
jgi:transcriptional regulator with XRE-family HTH domain